jgi:hypothetical protein
MTVKEKTCAELVQEKCDMRLGDIEDLFRAIDLIGPDDEDACFAESALEQLEQYPLCFDYVAPDTWEDQLESYFRYQISWGGPSSEIRFFYDDGASGCYKIRFHYMDWNDGAYVTITDNEVAKRLWNWITDSGETCKYWREEKE